MKKLLSLIVCVLVTASAASAASATANVDYKSKVFDRGQVAFENTVVAGVGVEVAGFVLGVDTYSPVEARTIGKTVASSGLLKRVDLIAGYKFKAPLADLTLGGSYQNFSKSTQLNNIASNTEPFAKLDGKLYGTLLTWDATAKADLKNRSNNLEVNARWPVGFKHVKIVPAIGFGFNDPGAVTIAAFRDAKRYNVVGLGTGYFTKAVDVTADWYQRRDTLLSAAGQVNGWSVGVHFKL